METANHVTELRDALAAARTAGRGPVALVPTMGNLHAGHLALVEAARRTGGFVVSSVFVNPLQFAPGEDFGRYPRTPERDAAMLAEAGADLLFAPDEAQMYPNGTADTKVQVDGLSDVLCGAHRPGHFTGVTTVVSMLFNLVGPDVAFFGEKDYQQLVVIRRMAADLHFSVRIEGVPTVREADGLALSSRNQYLSADERRRAPELYAALCDAAARLAAGERDFAAIQEEGRRRLERAGFEPDYFEVRAADLARPDAAAPAGELRVLAAGRLGGARLIDNVPVRREPENGNRSLDP